jgi:perosamine synthetase
VTGYPRQPPRPIQPARQHFSDEDIAFIANETGRLLRERITVGPWVEEFERLGAASAGTKHGLAVNNCTTALEIILRAAGIGPGDEVVVPPQTFIATAFAVIHAGARPVFCEINPRTHCVDAQDLAAKVTAKTRGVILVHMGGLITPDLPAIERVCRERGLALIEDCAHAHGASKSGRPAGSIGIAGAFSYYATKVLTTGEGGLITTNDDELAKELRCYQARGQDLSVHDEEVFIRAGRSCRMTAFSGLCGVTQYKRLEEFVGRRNRTAAIYDRALEADAPGVERLPVPADTRHSYWKYSFNLPAEVSREDLQRLLAKDYRVPLTWSYWPPVHLMPVMRRLFGCKPGDLPASEAVMRRNASLPMHAALDDRDACYVAESFVDAYRRMRKP